jgi:hypothetical protein
MRERAHGRTGVPVLPEFISAIEVSTCAVVCLGVDAGARHGVKTGESAALLNRR